MSLISRMKTTPRSCANSLRQDNGGEREREKRELLFKDSNMDSMDLMNAVHSIRTVNNSMQRARQYDKISVHIL